MHFCVQSAFDGHDCHCRQKPLLTMQIGWASCHVWYICKWLHTQTHRCAPDGTKRRSRCREIVLTLLARGHLVDPIQNAAHQSLRQLRHMSEQRPEAFAELERVWHCYANGGVMCDGPVAVTHSILRWWAAIGRHLAFFARDGRLPLGLLDEPYHPLVRTHMAMHCTHSPVTVDTNTLFGDVQTASDCQSDEPNNQSAHSHFGGVFGYFAERASPTGYQP